MDKMERKCDELLNRALMGEEVKVKTNEEKLNEILGEDSSNKKLEVVPPSLRMISFDEKITNFNKVRDEVWSIADNSKDYTVNMKNLAVNNELKLFDVKSGQHFDFSHWSLNQLCSSLDVPVRYIKKCMIENPALAHRNLNGWLERTRERDCLLRVTNDRLVGFLSSKYTVFDDVELLPIIYSSLNQQDEYIIMEHIITPELLNLRLVKSKQLNIAGEDLSVGLNIKNSRVGKSKVDIELLIYKWKCTNGIIFGGGAETYYSKRHVGIDTETIATEFEKVLSEMPKNIELIKSKVEALRKVEVDDAMQEKLADKFEKNKFANKAMIEKIFVGMQKYDNTAWGFVNSMTEVAQEYNMDTRERIERYAGQLLTA